LLLIAALAPATFAAPSHDTVIEENEVVNNDVVVFDGDLEIHTGAVVNGDVAVFNGDAAIDGQVNGSLTLFNGDLIAGPDAAITGECVLLNGEVTSESHIGSCTAVSSLEFGENWLREFPAIPAIPAIPDRPERPAVPALPEKPAVPAVPVIPAVPSAPIVDDGPANTIAAMFGVVASSLLFGFLGLLAGAIMPNQLRQIVHTAREKTVVSGMAGALTAVAVPALIILLIPVSILLTFVCIGLLGFPIMILLALGLFVGGFLGWIAVGTWLGVRLFGRGEKGDRIVRSAGLGTALLTLGLGLFGLLTPFGFIEGLLSFLIACIGLGAVALTQFGMKPYPRRPQAGATGGPDAGKVETVLNTLPPEEATA
jgi:hypothetical protein